MIPYSKWASQPLSVRNQIAHQFGVARTGPTHVQDNRVVQDGFNLEALENALSIDVMKAYVGVDDTDMETLWDLMIAKITSGKVPEAVPIEIPPEPTLEEPNAKPEKIHLEVPKKKGRPAKKK